jgi:hypothetical protein
VALAPSPARVFCFATVHVGTAASSVRPSELGNRSSVPCGTQCHDATILTDKTFRFCGLDDLWREVSLFHRRGQSGDVDHAHDWRVGTAHDRVGHGFSHGEEHDLTSAPMSRDWTLPSLFIILSGARNPRSGLRAESKDPYAAPRLNRPHPRISAPVKMIGRWQRSHRINSLQAHYNPISPQG